MLDENIKNNIMGSDNFRQKTEIATNYQTALNLLESLNTSLTLGLVKEE